MIKKITTNMASFKDFLSTFSSSTDEKGKQFERFVKWFLVNDPTWKTQVEKVWHWAEYPDRWGADLGIDLVFKHKNGDLWAVQAKCYAESTSITKAHVDSFISESDSKTFAGRLLIGTTDSLADNAKKVCDRQNVTRFLLSDFESSAFEGSGVTTFTVCLPSSGEVSVIISAIKGVSNMESQKAFLYPMFLLLPTSPTNIDNRIQTAITR